MSSIIDVARTATRFAIGVALLALAFAATAAPANAELEELEGVIHIESGVPATPPATVPAEGSWVRIQQPGNLEGLNNFLPNPSSTNAADNTYTPLQAGAGELELGQYQDDPVEDSGQIVTPSLWGDPEVFAAPFEIFTFHEDPAEEKAGEFPVPHLEYDEETGHVTGDLGAWTVNFGGFWFSQGANSVEPGDVHHPDGNLEGHYDPGTGHIELNWSSLIVDHYPAGFNNHVGYWRIEGILEPPE